VTLRATLAAVPILFAAPGLALGAPLPTPTVQAPAEPTAFEGLDPLESFGGEISVEVVGLQVWVTDRKGRPVTGLERDDFVLLQDGEPVEIVNFAVYEGAAEAAPGEAEDGTPRELAPLDLGGDDPVHLAILVDNWNMRPEDRARVFKGLREFLEARVRPADRVAILVHDRSLKLVQGFTDDREELAGTLARMEKVAPSALALRSEQRQAIEGIENAYMAYFDSGRADPDLACQLGAGWGSMENAARHYAAAVQAHARVSAAATASAAGTLAGLPGHRVLLYVGAGLPQTAGIEVFQLLARSAPAGTPSSPSSRTTTT
jgi:VWFA-related protein